MSVVFAACGLYLLLVSALLAVAYSHQFFRYYAVAKAAASVGFVALATFLWVVRGQQGGNLYLWLLPSLLFCLAGDVLLGLANTKGKWFSRFFLGGAACFTLAHLGFCLCFTVLRPGGYRFFPAEWLLPAVMLAIMLLCLRDQKRFQKLHKMRGPGTLYSVFVGLMCAKSFTYAISSGFSQRGVLIAAGGILFLISDVVLVFLYFYYKPRRLLRAVNLGSYYLAMLCFALAV